MTRRLLVPALGALATLLLPALAAAGSIAPSQVKKWPELDRAWARSFDIWMSEDEVKVFVSLKSTDERVEFLTKAGYMRRWEAIEDEMLPHVVAGDVVEGMTQDEVYMCWDKPEKIRKDFRKDAYVDVLNYQFERDRKGREWLLRPDSQTAYKNEIVTKYVYLFNGKVWRILEAGQEESVLDELPVGDKAAPAAGPAQPAGREPAEPVEPEPSDPG